MLIVTVHWFEFHDLYVPQHFRFMLRAAHTKSIHGKTRTTAAQNARTRSAKEENVIIDGYNARVGTKRALSSNSGNNSNSCSSSRGSASKFSRTSHGGRTNVTSAQSAKETAEVSITFFCSSSLVMSFVIYITEC